MQFPRLAFVDVETTGLGADQHRIAEIGVVTVDGDRVDEWGTLLDPGRRITDLPHEFGAEPVYFCADRATDLPRFAEIAADLASRLDGRLLIAHNARFDYAFLKSEFDRLGIAFAPRVLCTVMLSRKLFPTQQQHDLDALSGRHRLPVGERHRALPDARLLHQFWTVIQREVDATRLARAIDALLTEPLLPEHIDLAMIDALPERPGVYTFHGDDDRLLQIGRATNLRRHVKRYFRLDRNCASADALSHRLRHIRWQVASGPLDARLRELALRDEASPDFAARRRGALSIHVDPAATPAAAVVRLADPQTAGVDLFGLYGTERKAKNALRRLAAAHQVCHRLLGSADQRPCPCGECIDPLRIDDANRRHRAKHLLRMMKAISPLRLQPWPYPGPIAIREGRTLHVFDRWEHLGSVRAGSDMHALMQMRRNGFDLEIYKLLTRVLPRLSAKSVRNIPMPADGVRNEHRRAERNECEPA